nr:hypothetical protein [Tanacetum cinerariifolium]
MAWLGRIVELRHAANSLEWKTCVFFTVVVTDDTWLSFSSVACAFNCCSVTPPKYGSGKHDGEIDFSTLTLEQYFRLIEENQAPSMVNDEFGKMIEKDIEDMIIVEYIEYEADMQRKSERDAQSYFPTKYDDEDDGSFHLEKSRTFDYPYYVDDAKIETYYDLPPLLPYGKSMVSEQDMSNNTNEPDAPNLEPHDEGMSSDDDGDERLIIKMEEHIKRESYTVLEICQSRTLLQQFVVSDSSLFLGRGFSVAVWRLV